MSTQNSVGSLSEMAIAQESIAGTAETTPIIYDYFTGDPSINPMQDVLFLGNVQNRDTSKHALGGYHMEGSVPQMVEPEGMVGWWLKFALGSVTAAQQGGTAAYKHTYKPAKTLYPFTLWFNRGGTQNIKIPYSMLNTITFTQAINDALRMSVGFVGQKDQIATDFGSASYSTLGPITNSMLTVSIAGATTGQAAQVHNTTINFGNGIDVNDGMVHGARFFGSLVPGPREVTGSLDIWFDDDIEYERFWGAAALTEPGTDTATVALSFEWDTGVLADTGYNYILKIYIPAAIYTASNVNVGANRIVQTIEFTGEYDSTSDSVMYAELTNTVTQYSASESVEAAIALDGAVYSDETTEANEVTANDMTLLPAAPAEDDAYYIGGTFPFQQARINIGTQGVGTWTVTWEYWNGSAWTALSDVVDGTTGFTATTGNKDITFTMPTAWLPTSVNSQDAFYIRGRVSAYTSITTQPLGTQAWVFE